VTILDNSLKTGPDFFLQHLKNKIIFNFVKFVATKQGLTTNFFHPSLLLLFLDPGSEIQDPGSEIRDPEWLKIRIRDKHPGSATQFHSSQIFGRKVFSRLLKNSSTGIDPK
jgi:hypothetical protein